jgi:hypothetical protein
VVQHDHPVRERHHHLHHVLDHADGEAQLGVDAAHQLDRRGGLVRGEAGHGLVEQQEAGRGGERAGDLEPLLVGQGEGGGDHVLLAREAGEREQLQRAGPRAAHPARAPERPADHVLEHRHTPEAPHHLPGARDAEPAHPLRPRAGDVGAVEDDPALVRVERAADAAEERGLARAIGPDEPHDLARLDRQRDVAVGDQAAEALGAPLDLQQGGHRGQPFTDAGARPRKRAAHAAHGSERSPLGRQPAISMMTAP